MQKKQQHRHNQKQKKHTPSTNRANTKSHQWQSNDSAAKQPDLVPLKPHSQRTDALLHIQQKFGNTFAQQAVQGYADSVVQRDDPDSRKPTRPVPALPDELVINVEDQIAAGNHQLAINLIVIHQALAGRISLSTIEHGFMRYDASLTDEGHTQQWWRTTPEGGAVPEPSTVRIGPPAFASVPWLYTAIIHEGRHAKQFQELISMPDRQTSREVDAYLHNIENAEESGLKTDEVLELWQRLNDDWWSALTDPGVKELYQARYDAAQDYVNSLISTPMPVYYDLLDTQVFFDTGQSELNSDANQAIADLVAQVQEFTTENPDYNLRVKVTGHASPRWRHPQRGGIAEDLNQALSEQRANATVEQLQNAITAAGNGQCDFQIETCVGPERVADDIIWDAQIGGLGAGQALAEGRDPDNDDADYRRADIVIEYCQPAPEAK